VTANANPGYVFDHWTGDLSGSTNPGQLTMNGNKSVTAVFVQRFSLTTAVSPSGGGTVGLNPPGGIYDSGTSVTVTANASAGYVFHQWTGDLSGSANPAQITMNANRSVTANFILDPGTPYITDVTPDPFGLGETLTIAGLHFGTKKPVVYWGTAKGKVLTYSDTSVTFNLAKGTAGTQDVKVVANKVASNTVPAELGGPTIDNLSVDHGTAGAPVTLYGDYFGAKTPKVYFRSETTGAVKSAKVSSYDAVNGSITVAVPKVKKGDYGPYVIYVVNGAGTSNEEAFQVNP
jgi:hypothetical protein